MIRIILDARTVTNHFPGIGRYVFNLARAMSPLLNDNEQLILLRDPSSSSPWNLAALAGERTQIIDVPFSPFSLRQQWVMPQLLRQLQANLYHSPYYLRPYWPGVPTVLTVYDLIPRLYPHYFSARTRWAFRWTMALALHTAAHIVTISTTTRRDLLALYRLPPTKVTSILLAADPVFYPQPSEIIANLRTRLNLPAQYVLYVGTNKPHKNLTRLIEAWKITNCKLQIANYISPIQNRQSEIINRKLVIAGMWDNRYPEARQQVEVLGLTDTVQFVGPVADADLPALYSGATMFVFPSEYEGFGLPVLEAMACGAPVVCANTSSLPEIAGEAALTFNPIQVDSIASVLEQVLNDPILSMRLHEQGLWQSAQFSWQQTAQATLEMYRTIIFSP